MFKNLTILHNPRCQKSRQALALLQDTGLNPIIRLYLQAPLNSHEIEELLQKGRYNIMDIIRNNEAIFQELNVGILETSDWIAHIVKNPILLQRPIIITESVAILGRDKDKLAHWIENTTSS